MRTSLLIRNLDGPKPSRIKHSKRLHAPTRRTAPEPPVGTDRSVAQLRAPRATRSRTLPLPHEGKASMYQTDQYEGMIAETVSMRGHNGDIINAYVARPLGAGPFPGMIVIHHAPGWDEWYRECTRRFAHHGYVSISPNLYFR